MLKSKFSGLSEKISMRIGMLFSKLPISPNQWTILSIIPALVGFYFLAFQHNLLFGIISFAIAGIMDAIDGGVARVVGKETAFGAYLDGMFDRLVEFLLILGLIIFGLPSMAIFGIAIPSSLILICLLFFGTAMVSFSRAYADHRKAISEEKIRQMPGLFERAERVVTIIVAMIAGLFYPLAATYLLMLATVLSIATLWQRILFVYKNAKL